MFNAFHDVDKKEWNILYILFLCLLIQYGIQ